MRIGNEQAIWLIFVAAAVLVPAYVWAFSARHKALRAFADAPLLGRINPAASMTRRMVKALLLIGAFILIAIALMEPAWDPKPRDVQRKGRDVVFLLDVSRSMLAEDIRPSRLERAKLAIRDAAAVVEGDRIGLVTFAGSASVRCPLTHDYSFFRMVLEEVSTESTLVGGTLIGDAIRTAVDKLFDADTDQDRFRDIILITDGEDHESFPDQAAARAAEAGVRIIAIGLGDRDSGARIPIAKRPNYQPVYLKNNQGEVVWSRLETGTLEAIAAGDPDNVFLAVEPGTTFNLDELYMDLVATAEKRVLEESRMVEFEPKFQLFLAAALALLMLEVFVGERKGAL